MTTPEGVRFFAADLRRRFGISNMTTYRWERDRGFPLHHYVGERRAWWAAEVLEWEAREMARPASERRGARNLAATEAKA